MLLSFHAAFATAKLDIALTNGTVVLSWPTGDYVLETSQGAAVPFNWSASQLSVNLAETNRFVLTQPSNTMAFYRLAPAVVQGLALSPETGAFVANWSLLSGAQSYNLYLAATSGVSPANYQSLPGGRKISATNHPTFIYGLASGVRYYAVVTGNLGANETAASPEANAVFGPHAEVTGAIFVNVPGAGGTNAVFVTGAQVWLINTTNGVATAAVPTDAAGSFTIPPQRAGTYTLCYTLTNGFTGCGTICSTQQIQLGSQAIALSALLLSNDCTVVSGQVRLDGSFSFQDTDPFFGYDVRAQVKLVNSLGQTNVASVNQSGEFVFLGVPPGSYTLQAICEGAQVTQNIQLPAANAILLDLPGHIPILRNAFASDPATGDEVFQALPGATVRLTVEAFDPDGDPLTYDWIPGPGSVGFQSTNSPTVLWQLPNSSGTHIMYFVVRDHQGGLQTGKLAISTDPFALFSGTVLQNGVAPTNGAQITINGQNTTADTNGFFSLAVTNPVPPYVLTIESEGAQPSATVLAQPQVGTLYSVYDSYVVTIFANPSFSAVVTGGRITIVFPPGSIINNARQPVFGPVRVTFSAIDPSDPLGRFPGSLNRIVGYENKTIVPYAGVRVELAAPAARVGDPANPLFIESNGTNSLPIVSVPLGTFLPPTNTPIPLWAYNKFSGKYDELLTLFASTPNTDSLAWSFDRTGISVAGFITNTGCSIVLELADSIDLPVEVTQYNPFPQTHTITKRFTTFNEQRPFESVAFTITRANELVLSNSCVISNTVITGPLDTAVHLKLGFPGVPEPKDLLSYRIGPGSAQYGESYYKAIDPNNTRLTFDAWKLANGFGAGTNLGADAEAIYFNNGDLGFGRWMGMKTNANGDIAYFVSNYGSPDAAIAARGRHQQNGLGATVCMEYSAHPTDTNSAARYTKFYIFDEQNNRAPGVELDGRGVKYAPHLCIVCHGGIIPPENVGKGDVKSKFLPFDLESFLYSADSNFTRQAQSAAFKVLNTTTLRTAPTASVAELVEGWYGGAGFPSNYNNEFIPPGWTNSAAAREVYSKVFKGSCRSCHISREDKRALADYDELQNFNPERLKAFLCPPSPTMPNALRTFNIFGSSQCSAVSQPQILRTNLQLNCP